MCQGPSREGPPQATEVSELEFSYLTMNIKKFKVDMAETMYFAL
jgi:hypothetical protein